MATFVTKTGGTVTFSAALAAECALLVGAALSKEPLPFDPVELLELDRNNAKTVAELVRVIELADRFGVNTMYERAIDRVVAMIGERRSLGFSCREWLASFSTLPEEVQLRLVQLLVKAGPVLEVVEQWVVLKSGSAAVDIPGVLVATKEYRQVGCDLAGHRLVLGEFLIEQGAVTSMTVPQDTIVTATDGTKIRTERYVGESYAWIGEYHTRQARYPLTVTNRMTGVVLPEIVRDERPLVYQGVSPSGRYAVATAEDLYVVEGERTLIKQPLDDDRYSIKVIWSPDETQVIIAIFNVEAADIWILHHYHLLPGTMRTLVAPTGFTVRAAMSNTHLFYSTGYGLRACSLSTLSAPVDIPVTAEEIEYLCVCPDGRLIVFTLGNISSGSCRCRVTIYRPRSYQGLTLSDLL